MPNTNASKFEPRVKELLLERRHSICLEVSKTRRQRVASSIFLPKECIQIEHRLKTTSVAENESITTSKNRETQDLEQIKRKNIRRLIKRMSLKQIPYEAKCNKKRIAKGKQILKHPSSYPIVKQTVSSEKVRCVVESLRDESYAINTKNFDSKTNEQTSTLQIHANYIADDNYMNPIQNSNKNLSIKIEKELSPIIKNRVQILTPLSNYNTINSADDFVVIMDATTAQTEIKYDKKPSPFPNEHIILRDSFDGEKTQSKQEDILDLSLKDNIARTSSLSSTCFYNVSNKKPIFTPYQKGLTYVSKSDPLFEHHDHSFIQKYSQQVSSTSPRSKQRMSNSVGVNICPRYLQLHSRNKNILESKALRENFLPNFMSREVFSSSYKNEFCPLTHRFQNHSFTLGSKAQIHPSDMMNCFPNQLYENCLKTEMYDFPTSTYSNIQQQKLVCVLQTPKTCNIYNLDLPQPLYHPLHQNLHYFPPQYRSKTSSTGLGPFENQRCDVASKIPQFTFAETKPTYLPPTPWIPEYINPTDFPFPSPNLRNTHKKCATPPYSNLNSISPHLYQPELSITTELLTDLRTPTYVPCPSSTLAEHVINNFSPPHINIHSPH